MTKKFRLYVLFIGIFCASCAGSSGFMKPMEKSLSPTENKALVRFMRPSGYGYAVNFNILDGDKVIGNSIAKSQFDYLASPGKHLFIATAENKAFLEADLEGGKTYYIITEVRMGAWKARTGIVAVNKGSKFWNKVKEYEDTLIKLEPKMEDIKRWEERNKPKLQKVLSDYKSVWKDKYQWPRLNPEDGR